jgi:hypothetical protein
MALRKGRILLAVAAVAVLGAGIALTATAAGAAGSVTASFSKDSDWGTGYQGKYTITNGTGSAISGWTVTFDLPAGVSMGTYWDALISTSGQHVTAKNREYNGAVAAGSSASFGFVVSGGSAAPTNCAINGASCSGGGTPSPSASPTRSASPGPSSSPVPSGGGVGAPYLYFGWGDPPSPTSVMSATGVKWFTLAFMLSGGGCTPSWDSQRPLTGGVDQQNINAIRAAGGDIVISFGGWSGNKLGPNCSSASALAGAYQQVIDAYRLKAIDIDIENTDEFQNATVQDRILGALKIVKQNNPGIRTILTFGTTTTGPESWGSRLISQSKALGANVDVYTIMPFDFGGSNMLTDTTNAAEGLKSALMSAFGWSAATAYTHMGISSMNGLTDSNETVSPATFQGIRDYAQQHHLARLAFWSVNRDRPCPGGGVAENCSGISQSNWQFTAINATFTG